MDRGILYILKLSLVAGLAFMTLMGVILFWLISYAESFRL